MDRARDFPNAEGDLITRAASNLFSKRVESWTHLQKKSEEFERACVELREKSTSVKNIDRLIDHTRRSCFSPEPARKIHPQWRYQITLSRRELCSLFQQHLNGKYDDLVAFLDKAYGSYGEYRKHEIASLSKEMQEGPAAFEQAIRDAIIHCVRRTIVGKAEIVIEGVRLGDVTEVEDLVGKTLAKIQNATGSFETKGKLMGFANRVASNAALDELKKIVAQPKIAARRVRPLEREEKKKAQKKKKAADFEDAQREMETKVIPAIVRKFAREGNEGNKKIEHIDELHKVYFLGCKINGTGLDRDEYRRQRGAQRQRLARARDLIVSVRSSNNLKEVLGFRIKGNRRKRGGYMWNFKMPRKS